MVTAVAFQDLVLDRAAARVDPPADAAAAAQHEPPADAAAAAQHEAPALVAQQEPSSWSHLLPSLRLNILVLQEQLAAAAERKGR